MLASKLLGCPRPSVVVGSARTLCHKSSLKPKSNNYRWPYDRRSWGYLNFWMDFNSKGKWDENSLIIQVEGNVSAGKENFAKMLAEELGMHYMPQPDLEAYYINDHGYDYRALNPLLPERLRICDWEMFHENPTRHSVIHMQNFLFKLRLHRYYEALRHLFNTGQGVVMTRTCYSERVMVEAMDASGWLPKGYLREDGAQFYDWKHRYVFIRNWALTRLSLSPHLCIYLDTPVDLCHERVKNDPDPMVANSKALTKEFLEEIDTAFKDIVLPKQEHNMHVHVVDNSRLQTRDDVMDVIDDVSKLNFEFDAHDTRFTGWDTSQLRYWYFDQRRRLTTRIASDELNNCLNFPWYDIAGMGDSISETDLRLRQGLYESHVGQFGFNQEYDTDPKVHGILRQVFGSFKNFGQRWRDECRTDFC